MRTVISEANSIEKCTAKLENQSDNKECVKNGLVNGLVFKTKGKMSLNHGGEAVELHGDIIDLSESSAILQLHPKPLQDDVVNNVDKSKRKSKKRNKKPKQSKEASENLNGAKVEEINHQKNSDCGEFSDQLSSDSNAVETFPSCSTAPIRTSDTICDSLTTGIEALALQGETPATEKTEETHEKIDFVPYDSELQMPMIMKIIQKDLSEPYSIYTYRYFIHNWPKLCFLVRNIHTFFCRHYFFILIVFRPCARVNV